MAERGRGRGHLEGRRDLDWGFPHCGPFGSINSLSESDQHYNNKKENEIESDREERNRVG